MPDSSNTARIEPALTPPSTISTADRPSYPPTVATVSAGESAETAPTMLGAIVPAAPERLSSPQDQLARLEDKTSRIEEKLSRSESVTQRVVDRFEAASHRMSEVAQQADLATVRAEVSLITRRIRNLPGFSALVLSSVITAVLTAVIMIAILRYMPALLGR